MISVNGPLITKRMEKGGIPQADTSAQEGEIDAFVASRQLSPTGMIYGLTEDEG